MKDVSVVILTLDEELHIERCIRSVLPFAGRIFVVDSGSKDRTLEIARSLGAEILENRWVTYATQFNWALDHCAIDTPWVMRLDADEYVTPELADEVLARLVTLPGDVVGVSLRRRVHFMGRWIRHGGYYPTVLLRLWRSGRGRCEQRWMDEHVVTERGTIVTFAHDFVDDNLSNLTRWTQKHNGYATREAADLLARKHGLGDQARVSLHGQAAMKRWLKQRVYAHLPLGLRAVLYFSFRYFLLLGWLDGRPGFLFHILQGLWYRLLADAKAYDVERRALLEGRSIPDVLRTDYGIDV